MCIYITDLLIYLKGIASEREIKRRRKKECMHFCSLAHPPFGSCFTCYARAPASHLVLTKLVTLAILFGIEMYLFLY